MVALMLLKVVDEKEKEGGSAGARVRGQAGGDCS